MATSGAPTFTTRGFTPLSPPSVFIFSSFSLPSAPPDTRPSWKSLCEIFAPLKGGPPSHPIPPSHPTRRRPRPRRQLPYMRVVRIDDHSKLVACARVDLPTAPVAPAAAAAAASAVRATAAAPAASAPAPFADFVMAAARPGAAARALAPAASAAPAASSRRRRVWGSRAPPLRSGRKRPIPHDNWLFPK